MEKNLKKTIYIYISIDIYLNHFALYLKQTQRCKSTTLQLKKNKKQVQGSKFSQATVSSIIQ